MKASAALHNHSHYSLLRALPKIPELVAAAKERGYTALALTDFDNLYGAIEFYKECNAKEIQPIIGVDAHIGDGKRLVLLAETLAGYKSLLALVSEAQLAEGPVTFTKTLLKKYNEGLIAIVPFLQGEVTPLIGSRNEAKATRLIESYQAIFSKDHLYIEVGSYDDEALTAAVLAFAHAHHFPAIAAQETYYLNRDDHRAWRTLRAIENRGADDEEELSDYDLSFRSSKELEEQFPKELLESTEALARRCQVELPLGKWVFPDVALTTYTSYDEALKQLIAEGIKHRNYQTNEAIEQRIEYEYGIICKKGYSPYFLVVSDLLRFARENGILTTTRGSAAGSLVSYLIGITNVDPIAFGLPFERFLNPERPSAPDIDMDFADNRREEMIEYAHHKYGNDHVAQIGTFGTMLARGVVRDVARALGYPYGLGDRIAKEIPPGSQGMPMTLERAMRENATLVGMYEKEPEVREIIDLGKKIEGCARHISVHAAGIVIAPQPLQEFTPVQRDPKGGKIITQYDMYSIEDAGLLKFDFLGIRNLAILAHSIELVEKIRGEHIDIEAIPMDDPQTFAMLARGETEGTFQLNGAGMTRYLKELKPSYIHDINAMVALFRPGPMESIPTYIERKHNPQTVTYLDPRMKEYLGPSHGLLVYQDDVLLTAITLAGYSWLEADKLRKAMGKKIPEVMQAEKEKLLKGFMEYGKLSKSLAEKLWKLIEPFAAYGFGKAHAASYGKVAYQTAYMKAHYPVEYMAAILTAEAGNIDTTAVMVAECKRMGIPVLPPDVNESFGDFTVLLENGTPHAIRFGLYSIKNVGKGVADSIIAERKQGGSFTSLSNFLSRITDQALNKKSVESLIGCGALDSLGERGSLLRNIELLLEYHKEATKDQVQDSLFASETKELQLPDTLPATLEERLALEKELLGLYVSGHPLDRLKEKLARRPMSLKELKEKTPQGATTIAAGMIENVRTILTRSGDYMAFITLADFDDVLEAVVFPKPFSQHKDVLLPEKYIACKGRFSTRNGELSFVAEEVRAL